MISHPKMASVAGFIELRGHVKVYTANQITRVGGYWDKQRKCWQIPIDEWDYVIKLQEEK